jgi:hypothetical protein
MFNDPVLDKSYQYVSQEHSPLLAQALFYHRTHENKPIRFKNFKYLKALYLDKSHHIICLKAVQSGVSEFLIVFAINKTGIGNVFYILPTDLIKFRFVASRFDKSIEYSSYYKSIRKNLDSANMKAFNNGIINLIGSNSEANFGEFVAPVIIVDEKNNCNLRNLIMAKERQAKQEMDIRYTIEVSNPTIMDYGIDIDYAESDGKVWMNKCDCKNQFEIDFFKHIVRQTDDNDYIIIDKNFDFYSGKDCNIICDKCGRAVYRFGDGDWVKQRQYILDKSGYRYSQFFTSPTPVSDHIKQFKKGLTNDREMQRFYNAVLGRSYTSSGAKILTSMMHIEEYNELDYCKEPCCAGYDIGSEIHCVVCQIMPDKILRVIKRLTIKDFNDICDIHRRYNIIVGVVDSRPEIRLSRQIVSTFKSMFMCDYLTESPKDQIDLDRKIIKVDRTTSIDGVKEAILLGQVIFPQTENQEFNKHLESSTRIWQEKPNSINEGRYIWCETKPDHFLHALNYCLISLRLLVMSRSI